MKFYIFYIKAVVCIFLLCTLVDCLGCFNKKAIQTVHVKFKALPKAVAAKVQKAEAAIKNLNAVLTTGDPRAIEKAAQDLKKSFQTQAGDATPGETGGYKKSLPTAAKEELKEIVDLALNNVTDRTPSAELKNVVIATIDIPKIYAQPALISCAYEKHGCCVGL